MWIGLLLLEMYSVCYVCHKTKIEVIHMNSTENGAARRPVLLRFNYIFICFPCFMRNINIIYGTDFVIVIQARQIGCNLHHFGREIIYHECKLQVKFIYFIRLNKLNKQTKSTSFNHLQNK